MLVIHKFCPKCGTPANEENIVTSLHFCRNCSTNLLADISEDELKHSEHKYHIVDTSKMGEPTEEDQAFFEELEQIFDHKKEAKPFLFMRKTPGSPSMKQFPKGLVRLGFIALLTIAMIIFLITNFHWYTLIPIVGVTLITLYKQKRP